MMISQRTRNLRKNQARDYNTPQPDLRFAGEVSGWRGVLLERRLSVHSHNAVGIQPQVNTLVAEGKLKCGVGSEGG